MQERNSVGVGNLIKYFTGPDGLPKIVEEEAELRGHCYVLRLAEGGRTPRALRPLLQKQKSRR